MALRIVLEAADAAVADEWEYLAAEIGHLPTHPDEFDWAAARDALYQDDDLARSFDQSLAGVDDSDDEHNRLIGMGDDRPAAWFS